MKIIYIYIYVSNYKYPDFFPNRNFISYSKFSIMFFFFFNLKNFEIRIFFNRWFCCIQPSFRQPTLSIMKQIKSIWFIILLKLFLFTLNYNQFDINNNLIDEMLLVKCDKENLIKLKLIFSHIL